MRSSPPGRLSRLAARIRSLIQGIHSSTKRATPGIPGTVSRIYTGGHPAGNSGALGPRRIAISLFILTLMVTSGLSVLVYRAFAVGGGQVFEGTKAPGAHEWWKLNRDRVEVEFCGRCHAKVVSDIQATRSAGSHPIAVCVGCHGGRGGHVAVPAKCADCHPTQAAQILNDAHASFITEIGPIESAERPSWTCKACHTKVEVNMQVTPVAPLNIILGP